MSNHIKTALTTSAQYHRQSLQQAIMVAQNHPVKLRIIEAWSVKEAKGDRLKIFIEKLKNKTT